MDHSKEDSSEEEDEQFAFNPDLKPFEEPQSVHFTSDSPNSIELLSREVTVVTTSGEHAYGSSQVKLTNIVDFSWEVRFYTGQLLAVHVSGDYIAYGIKAVGPLPGGVVKVVRRKSNDKCLLKRTEGMIQDISFAHILDRVILASVDDFGSLMVHVIEENSYHNLFPEIYSQVHHCYTAKDLKNPPLENPGEDTDDCYNFSQSLTICSMGTLLVHLVQDSASPSYSSHRVIWCPYIPEDEDGMTACDVDASKLLCLMHGNNAQLLNVGLLNQAFGKETLRPHQLKDKNGYLEIGEHSKPIVDASFSPDGTAIATVSQDGYIKFFQVDMNHIIPIRCLHEWQPHGDKPLSLLTFIDNHKAFTPHPDDQFWKFCITGAENNSELKVWSCETWTCLQTIRFTTEDRNRHVMLKASLDLSADYLIISDIHNKLLYIMQIYRYPVPNQRFAYIRSISQFLLPYPILSFGIVDAGIRHFKSWESLEDAGNEDGDDELNQSDKYVVVRMYLVQPKSLQEGRIAFQPLNFDDNLVTNMDTLNHHSLLFNDEMSNMASRNLNDDSPTVNHNGHQNLMTGQPYNSLDKRSPTEQTSQVVHLSNASPLLPRLLTSPLSRSPTISLQSQLIGMQTEDQEPLATSEGQAHFASGGSSPSREVQEIFSLNSSAHNNAYYDEKDLTKDVSTAVAQLSLMTTPTEEISQQYDCITEENGPLKSVVDGDRFPPIPPSLVNEARKSIGEDSAGKRHAVSHHSMAAGDTDLMNGMYKVNHKVETSIRTLNHTVASLVETIQQQNAQLKQMCVDMSEMQKQITEIKSTDQDKSEHDKAESQRIDRKQAERIEKTINHNQQEQSKIVKQLLKEQERKLQDSLLTSLSQFVRNLMTSRLPEIVADINHKKLEPVKQELRSEISQTIANTDHLLKEQITNLVHSKTVIDGIGQATVAALTPAVYSITQDVVSRVMLPSFERTCNSMFKQMSDTFTKGSNEYMGALNAHRDNELGKVDDFSNQLQSLTKNMHSKNTQLASMVGQEVSSQVLKGISPLHENMVRSVNNSVKEQISRCFQKQQASIEDRVVSAVRSGAITPAPHMIDTHMLQSQISQLIAKQDIDAAFNVALGAADLSLVVFACEQVNPQQLFNQIPLPLQPNTLMALIQQLSADMSTHTDLKHKYLEGAVMYMASCSNTELTEHLRPLILDLQQQLSAYLKDEHPNIDLTRNVQMLFLVTKSLLIT